MFMFVAITVGQQIIIVLGLYHRETEKRNR